VGLERSDSSPLTLCSPSGSPLRHHRRMFCMDSPKRVEEFLSRSYVQSGAHGLPKGSDTESHSRTQLLLVSRGKFPSITAHGRFLFVLPRSEIRTSKAEPSWERNCGTQSQSIPFHDISVQRHFLQTTFLSEPGTATTRPFALMLWMKKGEFCLCRVCCMLVERLLCVAQTISHS
jgi:hypothetical protein